MNINKNNPYSEETIYLEKISRRSAVRKKESKTFVLLLLMSFFLPCCSFLNEKLGLQDDNMGEEIIEKVIEMKFGVDVDLTAGTPE